VKLLKEEKAEDDEEDELIEVFEDEIIDGENDFFGLFMSTLIVSTIKFGVGGLEKEDDEEYKFKRTTREVLIMYGVSVAFFICAFGLLDLRRTLEEKADNRDELIKEQIAKGKKKTGEAFYEHFSKSVWKCLPGHHRWTHFIIDEGARTINRLGDLFVKVLTMSFAWSFMSATQWFLAWFVNYEASVLAISLAMIVSVFSVLQIYALDHIADVLERKRAIDEDEKEKCKGKEDDEVLRTLLQSIGILIGFVWESAFDEALEGIVGEKNETLWVKPVLGILTVAFMFPVWRMYIVPMEIEKGYILGFIPSKTGRRLENIFSDPSIGEDVKQGARVIFEEAVMVMMKNDTTKKGPEAMHRHLTEFLGKEDPKKETYRHPEPPVSVAEEQTMPAASQGGVKQ